MYKKSLKIAASVLAVSTLMAANTAFAAPEKKVDDAVNITVEARYFKPNFEFKAQTKDSNIGGNGAIDFKNDLGLRDVNAPEYRIMLGNNIRLSYTKFGFSGSATVPGGITWGGHTFNANVDSKLDMTYARLTWLKQITKSPELETKFLIDIKGFDFKAEATGTVLGVTQTGKEDFRGAIPTIGFAANGKISGAPGFSAFGEITGLPLGKYGHFYDLEFGVNYNIDPSAKITVGYRAFDLNVKKPDSNENAQFKLKGPFMSASYRF